MDDAKHGRRAEGAVHGYFLNARRIFKDIAKEVRQFKPGAEVAPGIVSIPAYGHTPGHTAFAIHSGNQSMLAMSDTVRNPYLFARHPDWQPIFDMDGAQAVEARRAMLDRAAADRMLVEAYHFPFPACGHMARRRPATSWCRSSGRRCEESKVARVARTSRRPGTRKVRPASGKALNEPIVGGSAGRKQTVRRQIHRSRSRSRSTGCRTR